MAQSAALAFERKTVARLRRFPREPDQFVHGLRVLVASIIRGPLTPLSSLRNRRSGAFT